MIGLPHDAFAYVPSMLLAFEAGFEDARHDTFFTVRIGKRRWNVVVVKVTHGGLELPRKAPPMRVDLPALANSEPECPERKEQQRNHHQASGPKRREKLLQRRLFLAGNEHAPLIVLQHLRHHGAAYRVVSYPRRHHVSHEGGEFRRADPVRRIPLGAQPAGLAYHVRLAGGVHAEGEHAAETREGEPVDRSLVKQHVALDKQYRTASAQVFAHVRDEGVPGERRIAALRKRGTDVFQLSAPLLRVERKRLGYRVGLFLERIGQRRTNVAPLLGRRLGVLAFLGKRGLLCKTFFLDARQIVDASLLDFSEAVELLLVCLALVHPLLLERITGRRFVFKRITRRFERIFYCGKLGSLPQPHRLFGIVARECWQCAEQNER